MRAALALVLLPLAACADRSGPPVTLEGVAEGGRVSQRGDSGRVVLVVPKGVDATFTANDRPALAYHDGAGRFTLRLDRLAPGPITLRAVDARGHGPTWRFTLTP